MVGDPFAPRVTAHFWVEFGIKVMVFRQRFRVEPVQSGATPKPSHLTCCNLFMWPSV